MEALADEDAWRRGTLGWHGGFVVLAAITAVAIVLDPGVAGAHRSTALTILGALTVWYGLTGARALGRDPARLGLVYVALAAPMIVALFALIPACALMLFVLYPHMWAVMSTTRAVIATVVVLAAVAAVSVSRFGPAGDGVLWASVFAVVGLVVALLVGGWTSRIIEQSRQRARLVRELATARADLSRVCHEAGVLAERGRVARDIHDTLAQGFASILLQLEAIESAPDLPHDQLLLRVAAVKATAGANLEEARSLIDSLVPPDLRAASLPEALHRLAVRSSAETTMAVTATVVGTPAVLRPDDEIVLLRCAQEAVANAHKHADAQVVAVELHYRPDGVGLVVRDDGRGLDAGMEPGMGLAGIRARAAEAGGFASVESVPGAGTTVRVDLRGSAG